MRTYGVRIQALTLLLARPLMRLTADFERTGDDRLRWPSLAMWSTILRPVGADGVARRDLPRSSRLSRRAARVGAGAAEKLGWVESDGTTLRLTESGREAARWAEPRVAAAGSGHESLRPALERLVAQLELEHPHFPVGYGSADPSITGGPGVDWKPVHREGPDTAVGLPVSALLSQALVALAYEYERKKNGALALVADTVSRLPDRGIRLELLPFRSHVTGLERHGVVKVKGDLVKPTWLGRRLRDRHEPLLGEIEAEWRERFGSDVVGALRAALEDAVEERDEVLPAYPLVQLHLGGWLDIPSGS